MLKIEKVNFNYGKTVVLNDFSLEVNKGDRVAILGPSGSGKSTLLRIIAGLEKVNSGKIFKDGIDITNVAPQKRKIGMLFQDFALFPNLTVHANIAYGANSKIRCEEVLELVSMQDYRNKYPHQLSGGQSQRVALARVLANDPDLIMLDEPFSSFDQALKENVRLQIKNILEKTKIPLIIVTHDFSDAKILATKTVIFECYN